MALINVKHYHSLSMDETRARSEKLANEVKAKLAGYGSQVNWRWASENGQSENNLIKLEAMTGLAKGLKGDVKLFADRIEIGVDLPLMLRGFKDPVEKQISEALATAFK